MMPDLLSSLSLAPAGAAARRRRRRAAAGRRLFAREAAGALVTGARRSPCWSPRPPGDLADRRRARFDGGFIVDGFARFMKFAGAGRRRRSRCSCRSTARRGERHLDKFEYAILVLLATLGMMVMVSANDLMGLYVGLELQSLALYVVAALNRDDARATEAGLKYFVLGALTSGMLLYGASLVYGFTGMTQLDQIVGLGSRQRRDIGLIFGMVFLLAGIAFKISAVPFHMWTPDVYEGAPTPVTAFFAAAPKVAAMALSSVRVTMVTLRADHPTGSRSSSSSRSPRWCSPPSPPSARTTSSACSPIPRSATSASRWSASRPAPRRRRGRRGLHGHLHRHDHRRSSPASCRCATTDGYVETIQRSRRARAEARSSPRSSPS